MNDGLNDRTPREMAAEGFEPGLSALPAAEEGFALRGVPNTGDEENAARPANENSNSGSEDAEIEDDLDDQAEDEDDDEENGDDDEEDLLSDGEEEEEEA
ncbi:MAG: hypothetical protein ABJC07_07750 [Acidobacteriota bacterium]